MCQRRLHWTASLTLTEGDRICCVGQIEVDSLKYLNKLNNFAMIFMIVTVSTELKSITVTFYGLKKNFFLMSCF
jgi:hypothetical protein